jgi:uncharacterized protein
MSNAENYIHHLKLNPHPEGGYYRETFRCATALKPNCIPGFENDRNLFTSIYFLIQKSNFSAFHKIKSDELWNFHSGDSIEIIEITPSGTLTITHLGINVAAGEKFQHVVPAGNWFGSRVKQGGQFSLVGCMVAPGFDFNDFEMAKRADLTESFPEHTRIIEALTRT